MFCLTPLTKGFGGKSRDRGGCRNKKIHLGNGLLAIQNKIILTIFRICESWNSI